MIDFDKKIRNILQCAGSETFKVNSLEQLFVKYREQSTQNDLNELKNKYEDKLSNLQKEKQRLLQIAENKENRSQENSQRHQDEIDTLKYEHKQNLYKQECEYQEKINIYKMDVEIYQKELQKITNEYKGFERATELFTRGAK